MVLGVYTHMQTHIHSHMKVISRNQACVGLQSVHPWFKNVFLYNHLTTCNTYVAEKPLKCGDTVMITRGVLSAYSFCTMYHIQSNLYNPMLHGRAKLCWITEVVRLSNCLHNSTLTIMLDYAMKLYNITS